MSGMYILDDLGRPMEVDDVLVWGAWFETATRIVEQTVVGDRLLVSTVFLGLNHNYGTGAPILWETMVFKHNGWQGTDFDGDYQQRYSSREKAEQGHRRAIRWAEQQLEAYDKEHQK